MTTRQKWYLGFLWTGLTFAFCGAFYVHGLVHSYLCDVANTITVIAFSSTIYMARRRIAAEEEARHYAQFKSDTDAMYATHNHYDE